MNGGYRSEKSRLLFEIATSYHEKCETYDMLVCHGTMLLGEIMPANAFENSLIQKNSREQLNLAFEKGKRHGISTHKVQQAIFSWRK